MASRRKRATSNGTAVAAVAGANMIMLHQIQVEQLASSQSSDICTYWSANLAFDPKRALLRRMFFINEDETKYVSVGFYPARDYQTLVEFGDIRQGGSKSMPRRQIAYYMRFHVSAGNASL